MITIPDTPTPVGVNPNTELYLCSNVQWDSEYKNLRLFANKTQAWEVIKNKAIYSTQIASIIKNDYVDVPVAQDKLLNRCNYIAYRNHSQSNFIYFGFVRDIEAKNTSVSRVYFDIDVFQTYYYGSIFYPSFVEREHINKNEDEIGANVESESISVSDYVRTQADIYNLNDIHWLVYCGSDTYDGTEFNVGLLYAPYKFWRENYYNNKMLMGCFIYDITVQDNSENIERNILDAIVKSGKTSEIAMVQAVPNSILNQSKSYLSLNRKANITETIYNNKCYTYPYSCFKITNYSGANKILKNELFSYDECPCSIRVSKFGTPCVQLIPNNYMGISYNLDETIIYDDFPQGAYTNNAYSLWLQGNKIKNQQAITNSLFNSLSKKDFVSPILTTMSTEINSYYNSQYEKTMTPTTIGGSINNNVVAMENNEMQIGFEGYCATNIKNIDNYFSLFGYATNKIKIPNLNNRKRWNYVKTVNCTINANISKENLTKLCNIFNNGVFIWHNDDIGNFVYSDN